ncbi:MAG: lyase family protein, partial [Selenomonadaceae bacterium]|nr:lyase family protein [Selenomonadaceae bacterium]
GRAVDGTRSINMGATAIGTGLNAEPTYIVAVARHLCNVTGDHYRTAPNLIDATNNTDLFADVSCALKTTALVLIKMANDFRMMASGPRCGLNELKLPARQPGSSIMPGKVNPVIAEVLNQTCYQVVANDMAVTMAVENGQFELNVMEPVLAFNIFNSMNYMTNAVNTFVDKLMLDLQPNRQQCQEWLDRSVGVITALLPHIGYENSAMLAKEAYNTGRPVREIILEKGILTKAQLDKAMAPAAMTHPGITPID